MPVKKPYSKGIPLQKKHGQYFLRDESVVADMLNAVGIDGESVFEIGCGDGFLTKKILEHDVKRLWVFEIDPAWAKQVEKECSGTQLSMFETNFLDVDFSIFEPHKPWTLLSNLPYHVTFPILKKVQQNRTMIKEGVVMVQEEVAQKIVKKSGRGYGFISLFYQHYFEWKMLTKVLPTAFYPHPKVYSRLLYFKPKENVEPIPDEEGFWKFIKICLVQPRRTLRNNLLQSHLDLSKLSEESLDLRAQQMSFVDFLAMWKILMNP